MNNMSIDMIQGQVIQVIEINLSVNGIESVLTMEFLLKDEVVHMIFHNVSCLNIKDFSMPYQICGFEILDNKDRGWDKSLRYTINDFEDGMIKFHCESFEFIKAE